MQSKYGIICNYSVRGDASMALPAVNPSRYTVPKRYEETKPVQIQGFAHTKIIGMT